MEGTTRPAKGKRDTMTGTSTETGAWVRRYHPAGSAATRLICFPYAGGSAGYYFPVSRALSPQTDVLAVQYPGRQDRRGEPCVEDLHKLADLVTAELRPWLDRPVTLFGHSLGATLAYEVALRLDKDGIVPLGLFASARRAPSCHRENERVHLGTDDELIAKLKEMSGTDQRVLADEELLRSVLPAIRGDYKAIESYRHRPGDGPVSCPVLVLTARDDDEVTPEEARAWSGHTSGAFTRREFSGGHFYLNAHAAEVIGMIREHLASAGAA